MFEPITYVERRKGLRERLHDGIVLLLGNELVPMNYADNPYRFRQDSSFLYYVGMDEPGLAVILDVDSGEEILFAREPTLDDIVWTGSAPSLSDECAHVGLSKHLPPDRLAGFLEQARAAGRAVHFLPPYRSADRLRLQRLLDVPALETAAHASRPLLEAVVDQRLRKSEDELAEIELAIDISHDMHTMAMQMIRPGMLEREVAGAVEGVVMSRGGTTSFPIILSVRGEVLHNHTYDNEMRDGQLVVHDSGATSPLGYASDITRTMPVSGGFDARQSDVYRLVLDAQLAAIQAMSPGVAFRDVHLVACRVIGEGLKDLGILKGEVDEAVAAGAHAICMPHGLGHMLGLDVHDMEALGEDLVGYGSEFERSDQFGLAYLRVARTLEPGFVLTVEPGIYFIPHLVELWRSEGRHSEFLDYERLESFLGFGGIRVEDDVVVTDDGHRVLGRPIPKSIEEIEAEMAR